MTPPAAAAIPARIPDGARVRKINSKPDDIHRDGARGTVEKGVYHSAEGGWGYLVVWDDMPQSSCVIGWRRIEELRPD